MRGFLLALALVLCGGAARAQVHPTPPTTDVPWTIYNSLTINGANALGTVANNAVLLTLVENVPTTPVLRQGFYVQGDGGAAFYRHAAAPCPLNSGNGDNGSQVKAADGGCWNAELKSPGGVNVQVWGAKGDGSTGDGVAINAATAYAGSIGGGAVWVPPTGAAYVIDQGLTVPAGVHLQGAGGLNWTSPIDNTESHWTNKSTWLHCTDTVNPCVDITGSSAAVEGINFWYTQPTPTSGTCANPCVFVPYTWTVFPYTIKVDGTTAAVGVWINNNSIVNASHCVDWEGPANGVFGSYSGMDRNNFGCFNVGTRFFRIDNTLNLSRLRYEMWWYQGSANWWYAMEGASHVDWDVRYLANPQVTDVEFSFSGTAIQLSEDGVTSGFGQIHMALGHIQAKGVSFNEVCQAMTVAAGTTGGSTPTPVPASQASVTGRFTGSIIYTDSTSSKTSGQCAQATPYAINLASNNANVYFDGIDGGWFQSMATIGGGAGGQLHLSNVTAQQYSKYSAGAAGVVTGAGSLVEFVGTPLFYPSSDFTAGPLCSGGGCGHANTMISGLEIGGVGGSTSELYFSNIKTPQSPGNYLGNAVWGWRNDTGGTFFLDRFDPNGVLGFIDTPLSIVPIGTGSGQTQTQISGEAVIHSGAYLVPILISALPPCVGANAGLLQVVSNGASSPPPVYGAAVGSTTGNLAALVMCNNTSWIYQ
jgi:hypothetical protein